MTIFAHRVVKKLHINCVVFTDCLLVKRVQVNYDIS